MSFGVEEFCFDQPGPPAHVIILQNIGTHPSLRAVGNIMESASIQTTPYTNARSATGSYFFTKSLAPLACILAKQDETNQLTVDGIKALYTPFVILDPAHHTSQYGLIASDQLQKASSSTRQRKTTTNQILQYTPPNLNTTILYAICSKRRDELCRIKIKHRGQWLKDGNKDFEIKALARSRRERGDKNKSQRLLKDGDTPQGIYQLWGSLFTTDRKFGAYPRIDIDGMRPPINFQRANPTTYSRIVPKDVFLDYWFHEFAMAHALGRYLFRIHDNSVDPHFPNTYTTPSSKQTLRASAGCLNTGDQIHKLLDKLVDLQVFSKAQAQNHTPYGRLESIDTNNTFLVIIDQDD